MSNATVTNTPEPVVVRMLRSVRVAQQGFPDGYAVQGKEYKVSPLVAQDWHYVGACEYVNAKDIPTDYQPDADLRKANNIATPNLQAELDALKAQVAALMAVKAK